MGEAARTGPQAERVRQQASTLSTRSQSMQVVVLCPLPRAQQPRKSKLLLRQSLFSWRRPDIAEQTCMRPAIMGRREPNHHDKWSALRFVVESAQSFLAVLPLMVMERSNLRATTSISGQ